MPWSASEASSRAAQQRMSQQHASQYQRFRRQGQQRAAEQMNDMMEKSRASRRQRRRDAAAIPPDNRPWATDRTVPANGYRPVTKMSVVLTFILATFFFLLAGVVTVAFVIGSLAPTGNRSRLPIVNSSNGTGIGGVVLAETWNVRGGPSVQSPSVGTVDPGQRVSVLCVTDGWAKLVTPFSGNFVYIDGVALTEEPPQC